MNLYKNREDSIQTFNHWDALLNEQVTILESIIEDMNEVTSNLNETRITEIEYKKRIKELEIEYNLQEIEYNYIRTKWKTSMVEMKNAGNLLYGINNMLS